MIESTLLTWDQLEAFGQLETYTTFGNVTKNIPCPTCEAISVCTYDYIEHKKTKCTPKDKSKGKLSPRDLDRLPWKAFRKGNGEWIFSNQATYLLEAIRNGNTTFGNYHYWLYGDNRFIARRRIT